MSFITTEISSFSTFNLVHEKYSYDYKCIFYRKGSHLFVYSIIGYDKVLNVEHIISIKTNVDMVLKGVDLKAKIVVNGCLYVQQMKVN